jgi:hypothetical protein
LASMWTSCKQSVWILSLGPIRSSLGRSWVPIACLGVMPMPILYCSLRRL